MGTTADKLEYLQGTKAAIKQAIVNKGVAVPDGTTFRAYAEKIGDIIDVPDLSNPGAAGDLRSGKQLVGADGGIITGTLAEVTQATPSISVSSSGLITASATQSGGIVEGGSKSATQQLTTQAAKTVTPGTSDQTAVASGRYTTGTVQVAGDANLVPENIAEGVSIFGVQGTHSGGGGIGEWMTIQLSTSPTRAGGSTITLYGTLLVTQTPLAVYLMMRRTDNEMPYPYDSAIISKVNGNTALINNAATAGRFGVSQLDITGSLWSLTLYADLRFGEFSASKCYALIIYHSII